MLADGTSQGKRIVPVSYFLDWFAKHAESCAECKRDGLASKCATFKANQAAVRDADNA